MKTPKLNGTRVVFGPVRLSYVHLLAPHAFEGDNRDGKYSTNILIPKNEKETIEAIRTAIGNAVVAGKAQRWGGKGATPGRANPLFDGDEKNDELYHGHYYLNAKSIQRPQVVDSKKAPLTSDDDVYSGMWACVSVSFYPYNIGGNGVACAINNVMKYKDDERLSGGPGAAEDFDGFMDDPDDL